MQQELLDKHFLRKHGANAITAKNKHGWPLPPALTGGSGQAFPNGTSIRMEKPENVTTRERLTRKVGMISCLSL